MAPGSSGSFKWRMVFKSQDPEAGCTALSGHQLSRVDQLGTLSRTSTLMLCPSLYITNHDFTAIPMARAQHRRVCTRLPRPTFVAPFSDRDPGFHHPQHIHLILPCSRK